VRPDPKQIGMQLEKYYPDYVRPQRRTSEAQGTFSIGSLLRNSETRLAIAANCAGQANMSIVMVLTSLVLAHHGHSLTAIALSHMFHSIGMFAFTIPLGRLADRHGRNIVMYPGVATTIVGAGLVTFTSGLLPVTLGTFLVGVGWAAANVAATALIADRVETHQRGRAIGVADSSAGGVSVAVALATGPLIAWSGLAAAGWTAVLVAAIPLLMLAASRLKGKPHAK
jgi:MFS family permease